MKNQASYQRRASDFEDDMPGLPPFIAGWVAGVIIGAGVVLAVGWVW